MERSARAASSPKDRRRKAPRAATAQPARVEQGSVGNAGSLVSTTVVAVGDSWMTTRARARARSIKARLEQIAEERRWLCLELAAAHFVQDWKVLGYPSFVAYTKAEFNLGRSHSYRLLAQAKVIGAAAAGAAIDPAQIPSQTERGTRKLVGLLTAISREVDARTRDVPVAERPAIAHSVLRELAVSPTGERRRQREEKPPALPALIEGQRPEAEWGYPQYLAFTIARLTAGDTVEAWRWIDHFLKTARLLFRAAGGTEEEFAMLLVHEDAPELPACAGESDGASAPRMTSSDARRRTAGRERLATAGHARAPVVADDGSRPEGVDTAVVGERVDGERRVAGVSANPSHLGSSVERLTVSDPAQARQWSLRLTEAAWLLFRLKGGRDKAFADLPHWRSEGTHAWPNAARASGGGGVPHPRAEVEEPDVP